MQAQEVGWSSYKRRNINLRIKFLDRLLEALHVVCDFMKKTKIFAITTN